jgi:hypothetical protein
MVNKLFVLEGQTIIDILKKLFYLLLDQKIHILGGIMKLVNLVSLWIILFFGPTKFKTQVGNDLRLEFLTKVVTDLGVTFQQRISWQQQTSITYWMFFGR